MAIPELRRRLDQLPGWLTYEEGETLYRLARMCTGRGVIVEIGSWRGKSTICLGLGSKEGNRVPVYAVDRHTEGTFRDFRENVEAAGIAELVRPVRGLSQDVAVDFTEPIELLFIDGAHQYELVKADWERWVPKVVEDGFVVMHDTTGFPGVRRVAEEEMYKSHAFKDVRFVFSTMTVGRKVPRTSRLDRIRNRFALALMRSLVAVRALGGRRIPKPLVRAGRRALRTIN
ncbi:MAG: class I SAM-dependent methyltransferase [Thermoleophilia bacterium]|nr:class I SAM-dependent methyltransferase [Thermoleophilia bacterium]